MVQTLPDHSRLLFSYEMGIFALHFVQDFGDYRKTYHAAQGRHQHTHRDIQFPDLFPPEELTVRERAERVAVQGWALGLFVKETDPETKDQAIYYYYVDRHGWHPVQLGRDLLAVEEHLFVSQREKEILANIPQKEITALERVEEDL